MRYFLKFAYKGTVYHGWQIQPNAQTIQGMLEKALHCLLGEHIVVNGSSRTDTGVHAREQYAHFDTDSTFEISQLMYRLNAFLPADIAVLEIYHLNEKCHSRFDAIARKYTYRIAKSKDPFTLDTSLYFNKKLDLEKLNKACNILRKHQDFESLSKVKTEVNNFICDIKEAYWLETPLSIEFHITANRFLRGMVRTIVGTMIDIGLGYISLENFDEILLAKNRNKAGKSAAAKGLCLEKVIYPENYFEINSPKL